MRWIKLPKTNDTQIYGRIDDDGLMRVTCVEEHPEFQAWLAEGNEAEEWTPEG
jgi:hypothetical protein